MRQDIVCYWRKAHFDGQHLLFFCTECHRSARVLYARYVNDRIWFFSCRKCAGITYQSTMGHRWDRSARRVEKLRARLEWGANGTMPRLGIDSGIAGGLPEKRKGMPARTYARLLEKTLEAEILADEAWLKRRAARSQAVRVEMLFSVPALQSARLCEQV